MSKNIFQPENVYTYYFLLSFFIRTGIIVIIVITNIDLYY